jgi:antitoxin (DNA-binding transcriptional repressor) of toxin-antitoxin stability system
VTSIAVSEARASLPELLDRVADGDEVIITRHGHPVAVLVRPDILRARRADQALAASAKVRELLAVGRRSPLPTDRGLTESRADELVGDLRRERRSR